MPSVRLQARSRSPKPAPAWLAFVRVSGVIAIAGWQAMAFYCYMVQHGSWCGNSLDAGKRAAAAPHATRGKNRMQIIRLGPSGRPAGAAILLVAPKFRLHWSFTDHVIRRTSGLASKDAYENSNLADSHLLRETVGPRVAAELQNSRVSYGLHALHCHTTLFFATLHQFQSRCGASVLCGEMQACFPVQIQYKSTTR